MDDSVAKKWNEVYGLTKDPVRECILFPLMIKKENVADKTILDAGCGNGSLILKLLEHSPKEILGIDKSEEFLRFAKQKIKDKRVAFLHGDICDKKNFKENKFDTVYTVGVLDKVEDIKTVTDNFHFCLKKGGKLIIYTVHPSYILAMYLFEKYTGKKNKKIIGVRGYFEKFKAKYRLTLAQVDTLHVHHTIENYINTLISAGFKITNFIEPRIPKEMIKKYPKYEKETNIPKLLIIEAVKE